MSLAGLSLVQASEQGEDVFILISTPILFFIGKTILSVEIHDKSISIIN